jgi:hypothetical protein
MAAVTSSTVWTVTPIAGVNVGGVSSTPAFKKLTTITCVNGRLWTYVQASETLASTDTIKIGASGSASSDSGSAGWTLNAPGGMTTSQYAWARKTSI